jgi:hypothetical protein
MRNESQAQQAHDRTALMMTALRNKNSTNAVYFFSQ